MNADDSSSPYSFPLAILVILVSAVLVYIYQRLKHSAEDLSSPRHILPGPPPTDPQNGNFPDIVQCGSLYEYLRTVHQKYGDVVQIWFGTKPVVSTASPQAFKDQIRLFDKPEMAFLAPVFGDRSIQFVNGEEAKQRRKNYDAFLNQKSVQDYFQVFKQVADEMVERLRSRDETPINTYDCMFHMACKAVGVTLFGEYFKEDTNVRNFKTLYDEFWPVLEQNFTNGLPEDGTDQRKSFDNIVVKVHGFVQSIISAHRFRHSERLFIDVVLETGLDETTVYGDILVYLVGGFHSVSTTRSADVQAEIHKEVCAVTGTDEISVGNIQNLRYLRQFMNETLRHHFVAPVATRLSGDNTIIRGYNIRPGTHIIQALCVVLTSSEIWQEPERFDVSRFDIKDSDSKGISEKRPLLAFCPFGFAGKRMCPGKQYFYTEALVFLGTLFKSFNFALAEDTPEIIPVVYGLLTRPGVDIMLTYSERNRPADIC